MSGPGVRFLYIPASDLAAMREFYSGLLGLDEIFFSEEEGLAYDCEGFQFTILPAAEAVVRPEGWATQPGWVGATTAMISWSIELSESAFRRAIRALRSAGVESLHDVPQWVGYWSFPVKDPMNNTVELSWPQESPEATAWPQ